MSSAFVVDEIAFSKGKEANYDTSGGQDEKFDSLDGAIENFNERFDELEVRGLLD